jgi:hypothetical protein
MIEFPDIGTMVQELVQDQRMGIVTSGPKILRVTDNGENVRYVFVLWETGEHLPGFCNTLRLMKLPRLCAA